MHEPVFSSVFYHSAAPLPHPAHPPQDLRDGDKRADGALLCGWKGSASGGGGSGRSLSMPHLKSWGMFNPSDQSVCWFLLSSSNLSQAAWGVLQKKETSLFIKSYELGVLILPESTPDAKGPNLMVFPRDGESAAADAVLVPLPYQIPPEPYNGHERIWVTPTDQRVAQARASGQGDYAQDEFGRSPWSPVSFYGPQCTGRQLTGAPPGYTSPYIY